MAILAECPRCHRKQAVKWSIGAILAVVVPLVVLVFVVGVGTAKKTYIIKRGYFKGNDYMGWEQRDRAIYIAGLVDGTLLSPFFDAPRSETEWFEQCTGRMDSYQVTAIVDKFMKENPERWHEPMHTLAYFAIERACKK